MIALPCLATMFNGRGLTMETVDQIWAGDLFNRREEAEDLIGYLQSVSTRPAVRDEGHAHVLAVDTSYGQGKSYFLRRLARHMAHEHAVAFVDAWVDDLEDQPMVALVATLDKALQPWVVKHPELADRMIEFRSRAGRVAKIVGVGLAKRAASFVIMGSGAEALGDEFSNDLMKDLAKDGLKDAANDVVDDITAGFGARMASSMEARISRFREGQDAIADMKVGLSQIVETLLEAGMKLPITIVIDELDRCRPTYAIKVLEELKHLFDVPGVAFVLGMHGQQLAHSVTAAYGTGFDSQAYLRRFFSRRYVLRDVALTPLVAKLCSDLTIPLDRLQAPSVSRDGDTRQASVEPAQKLIAEYIKAYGLAARDAFTVLEMLQTAMALTGSGPILLPLLMPMIIAHVQDRAFEKMVPTVPTDWVYVTYDHSSANTVTHQTNMAKMFAEMYTASKLSSRQLMDMVNKGSASPSTGLVADVRFSGQTGMAHDPSQYEAVLRKVSRFVSA
jgi:hypothetical protein